MEFIIINSDHMFAKHHSFLKKNKRNNIRKEGGEGRWEG